MKDHLQPLDVRFTLLERQDPQSASLEQVPYHSCGETFKVAAETFPTATNFDPRIDHFRGNVLIAGDSVGRQLYFWLSARAKRQGIVDETAPPRVDHFLMTKILDAYGGGRIMFMAHISSDEFHYGLGRDQRNSMLRAGILPIQTMIFRTAWPHFQLRGEDVGALKPNFYFDLLHQAQNTYGVENMIMLTTPHNNNAALNPVAFRKDGQMLREFVIHYNKQPPSSSSDGNVKNIKNLLLFDLEQLTNKLAERNARTLGIPEGEPTFARTLKGFNVLVGRNPDRRMTMKMSQALVCGYEAGPDGQVEACPKGPSGLSADGTHWCQHTVGPRFMSGILCLLSCMSSSSPYQTKDDIHSCEMVCNHQFASLMSVFHRHEPHRPLTLEEMMQRAKGNTNY
eukprot:CAMPEP_0118712918 /NCGR_PEP_ID=MMETSP0800-20121206/25161_1 /TAXON_ID=210618 ORGANISM="Striatella unipunctata, Strain CCMP2910" /NCGR_SAMPLE_ID=MMETSP0800 /ASSEMBLY_ACC=CAM_ASM_000638 /LENGTH=395 /DNA_ID=CAMNT_0006618179 /DNA_START=45 /DNA_END=1232 /DNA_ORIENTATION=+